MNKLYLMDRQESTIYEAWLWSGNSADIGELEQICGVGLRQESEGLFADWEGKDPLWIFPNTWVLRTFGGRYCAIYTPQRLKELVDTGEFCIIVPIRVDTVVVYASDVLLPETLFGLSKDKQRQLTSRLFTGDVISL